MVLLTGPCSSFRTVLMSWSMLSPCFLRDSGIGISQEFEAFHVVLQSHGVKVAVRPPFQVGFVQGFQLGAPSQIGLRSLANGFALSERHRNCEKGVGQVFEVVSFNCGQALPSRVFGWFCRQQRNTACFAAFPS